MIKLDGAADFPEIVSALVMVSILVWAQFRLTPQTALAPSIPYSAMNNPNAVVDDAMIRRLITEARTLKSAGAKPAK